MAELYTITDFPGFFRGISSTKLPPGAVVDELGRPTYNMRISNAGELTTSHGYSRVATLGQIGGVGAFDLTPQSYPNAMVCWSPPQGGDQVYVATLSVIYRLQLEDDTTAPNVQYVFGVIQAPEIGLPMADGSDWSDGWVVSSTVSMPEGGQFVPYKDSLYYCDGVNFPVRIWPSSKPKVYPMGTVPLQGGTFSALIQLTVTEYPGEGGDETPSSEYAVVMETLFGDSPAELFQGGSGVGVAVGLRVCTKFSVSSWATVPTCVRSFGIYRKAQDGVFRYVGSLRRGVGSFVDALDTLTLSSRYPINLSVGLPMTFRRMVVFQDRMFGIGAYGDPNRIFVSEPGLPDVWPAVNEITPLDRSKGGLLTAVKEIGGSLYFFYETRILRMFGSDMNYSFAEYSPHVGCVSFKSMASWREGVVFLASDGVYYFTGSRLLRISDGVPSFFEDTASMRTAVGAVQGDQYYLSFRDTGVTGRSYTETARYNTVLSFNLVNQRVGYRKEGAFLASCAFGSHGSLVVGPLNYTYLWVSELSDYPSYEDANAAVINQSAVNSNSISVFFPGLDFDSPHQEKLLESVEVWYECLSPIQISAVVDTGIKYGDMGAMTESVHIHNYLNADTEAELQRWENAGSSGHDWDHTYARVRSRHSVLSFTKFLSGKSFSMQLYFAGGGVPITVTKLLFHYSLVSPSSRGTGYVDVVGHSI